MAHSPETADIPVCNAARVRSHPGTGLPLARRLLNRLVECNRAYVERRRLAALSDGQIRDAGLDRASLDRGFYARYGWPPEDCREAMVRLHLPW